MKNEMKPFKAWMVTADDSEPGFFWTLKGAREDAADLRHTFHVEPTITPVLVSPLPSKRSRREP